MVPGAGKAGKPRSSSPVHQEAHEITLESGRLLDQLPDQLRQNAGDTSTSSVNISNRPSSMATHSVHLAVSLMSP